MVGPFFLFLFIFSLVVCILDVLRHLVDAKRDINIFPFKKRYGVCSICDKKCM